MATLVDLWYVTQTTKSVTLDQLAELRGLVMASPGVEFYLVNLEIADAYTTIDRKLLKDPWDRFITATARALQVPLVTRDRTIRRAEIVETIW